MNTKINKIIETYYESVNVDYAILLNGPWGCGKTYYIQKELKNIFNKRNIKLVYISLNGLSDFISVQRKITLQLMIKKGTKNEPDIELIDALFDIGAELPKAGSVISIISKARYIFESKICDKLDYSNYFFVFDDLERIIDKNKTAMFLGLIYENYVKKGVKTLFICDENNINNVDYNRIKEKVIRRTITYEPDFCKLIISLLKYKYEDEKRLPFLLSNILFYINLLNRVEIRNLRTINFIFDNYLYVVDSIEEKYFNDLNEFIL